MRALAAAALVAVTLTGVVPATPAQGPADPLQRAKAAAANLSYNGSLTVTWVDHEGVSHSTGLKVQVGGGVVRVGAGSALLAATTDQRWLFRDGEWDLVSPALNTGGPAVDRKFSVSTSDGPQVAGRPTTVTDLRTKNGTLDRLYLDQATGLLLRRDQVDARGAAVRVVAFDDIELDPGSTPVRPAKSVDRRPSAVRSVAAPYRAPAALAAGYQRTAVLRRDAAVQVVYSDGVHTLSVFEQRGRLDRTRLTQYAQPVDVRGVNGLRMVWAGGQVVVWQAGQSTFTVVGDGDSDEVLAAARSMPRPAPPTAWQRVRRACASLVDAVTG